MEYATIGNTDIQVSKLCLGFGDGSTHSWALDEQASDRIIHHALDVGINFFDTANVYSYGTSEEYLGRALKDVARDQVVLASKVYFNHPLSSA